MILLDYKDTRPIYEQIVEKFKILILKEILETDEKMPSVRNLAVELSINPNTIQRAYAELEREGYIYTIKGRGNFVADKTKLLYDSKQEVFTKLNDVCNEAARISIGKDELIAVIEENYNQ